MFRILSIIQISQNTIYNTTWLNSVCITHNQAYHAIYNNIETCILSCFHLLCQFGNQRWLASCDIMYHMTWYECEYTFFSLSQTTTLGEPKTKHYMDNRKIDTGSEKLVP